MTDTLKLEGWNFVNVITLCCDLARKGGVDCSDPAFLREATNVKSWEILDELGRDPKHLHKLTPTLGAIREAALEAGATKDLVKRLHSNAVAAQSLAEASLGEVGYTWLSKRQIASQLIYALACEIQGDPRAKDAYERQSRSEHFLMTFYGYGWYNSDPELKKELERYERQLGVLYCLRVVSVFTQHPELKPHEVVRCALGKYGLNDIRGRAVCYWCTGGPCVDGGRKGGIRAKLPRITRKLAENFGLAEMDRHMVVYGIGRNSAIDALAGAVRSLSEDGGEYGQIRLMHVSGGTIKGVADKLGCLNLEGTRYTRAAAKAEAKKSPLIESIYEEAGDAAVSWPPLLALAFGLNFARSVKLGLEHMAEGAGVKLDLPEDLTQAFPVKKGSLEEDGLDDVTLDRKAKAMSTGSLLLSLEGGHQRYRNNEFDDTAVGFSAGGRLSFHMNAWERELKKRGVPIPD